MENTGEEFILFRGSKIFFSDQQARSFTEESPPPSTENAHLLKHKPTYKGRCIVLLHGFLESSEIWKEYAQLLSQTYRVVCIDLPGHGKSESIGYVHTMEMMADCVKEILHSLQITKCVMIGHSMGGYVTLAFAEKYLRNLRGYALFHSHAAPDPEEKKKDRSRAIQVVKRNPSVLINELVPNLFAPHNREKYSGEIARLIKIADSMTRRGIVNCLEGMKDRPDRQPLLSAVKIPVLFILGKNDPVMNYEALVPQSELSAHIHLLTLENAGHVGFIEAKEECYNAIKKFIRHCHLPLQEGEE